MLGSVCVFSSCGFREPVAAFDRVVESNKNVQPEWLLERHKPRLTIGLDVRCVVFRENLSRLVLGIKQAGIWAKTDCGRMFADEIAPCFSDLWNGSRAELSWRKKVDLTFWEFGQIEDVFFESTEFSGTEKKHKIFVLVSLPPFAVGKVTGGISRHDGVVSGSDLTGMCNRVRTRAVLEN